MFPKSIPHSQEFFSFVSVIKSRFNIVFLKYGKQKPQKGRVTAKKKVKEQKMQMVKRFIG